MRNPFFVFNRSLVVFPLACVAISAFIYMSEKAFFKSVDTLKDLTEVGQANVNLQKVLAELRDAEIQMNAYRGSGSPEYKLGFETAVKNLDDTFLALGAYRTLSPNSIAVLAQFKLLTELKLTQMRSSEVPIANAVPLSELRRLRAQWLKNEDQYVEEKRTTMLRSLTVSRYGVVALSAASLIGLFFYLRQTNMLEKKRLEFQRLLQTEKDGLEVEVTQRIAQLTELTLHLQTAREDERNRLARNLHDDLGALLTSAKLDAARIKKRLLGSEPDTLKVLEHLVETLNSGIALGRTIIEDLRPSALANLGLNASLEILCREFSEQTNIAVEHRIQLFSARIEPTLELVIYRIVQEAFTNIAKHSKATRVILFVSLQESAIVISVSDNGIGFNPSQLPKASFGLVGMKFRVQAEGGFLTVVSPRGQGTQIQVTLPINASDLSYDK